MLEGRELNDEQETELTKLADIYINYYNDRWVLEGVDSNKKGLGEIRKLIKGINVLRERSEFKDIKRIFKLSGRYWLNSDFNIDNYSTDMMSFRYYNNYVSTVLYSVPISNLENYEIILHKCNEYLENTAQGIEVLFNNLIKGNFTNIKLLGVEGWVAVTKGELYKA